MAYFNSRTLGFYPGVDDGDKEDVNIPDKEMLDPYEWDCYDNDPYKDIGPHLNSCSPMTGEPGQHISVPPVVTSNLAGEEIEMGVPPDTTQGPEVMEEDHQPIQNPELEANEAQVKVMEEEREKVQKEVDIQPSFSNCRTQLNMSLEEKMDLDSRSVHIGNVDCNTPTEADSEGNLVKSIQENNEEPLIDAKQPLPFESYDINQWQCQVLYTFDLGSLQQDLFVTGTNLKEASKKDPKKDSRKASKEDPKKNSKKASNEDLDKDSKNTANEDPKKGGNKAPKKAAKEDTKKDLKIAAKKDPKKDSKKADVVPVNDARSEESIIVCENLLDEFEEQSQPTCHRGD